MAFNYGSAANSNSNSNSSSKKLRRHAVSMAGEVVPLMIQAPAAVLVVFSPAIGRSSTWRRLRPKLKTIDLCVCKAITSLLAAGPRLLPCLPRKAIVRLWGLER